jgi:hypothetical protein
MFVWSSEFAEPQQIIKRDEAMLLDTVISKGVLIFVSARPRGGKIHGDIYCCHFAPHAGVAISARHICSAINSPCAVDGLVGAGSALPIDVSSRLLKTCPVENSRRAFTPLRLLQAGSISARVDVPSDQRQTREDQQAS